MEKKIVEWRCPIDNTMFSKVYINSICETKCRKCKHLVYFIQGDISIKDINNYFKGDE